LGFVSIPKLINSLMADLQTDARDRSVKLVCDASTDIKAPVNETLLHGCLAQLIGTLVRDAPTAASLSLITAFEPGAEGIKAGKLRIEVQGSFAPSARFEEEVRQASNTLAPAGVQTSLMKGERTFALSLLVPGAENGETAAQRTAVVVDDDVDTQEFLAAVLESQGFRVVSVSDGFDALIVIERYSPDVVLTDILMPNMNGIDLVSRIKSFRSDLPVIVFSGYRDALVKNIAGLPDRILPKPMSRDQVLEALDSVLAK
jgi:CheY-like chemotaxis protein